MTTLVAAAIILDHQKVLIARRAKHKHLAGFWEFPGGKVEPDESPEQCLVRELDEEMKILIKVNGFFAEQLHDYGEVKILLKAYFCSYISGEFTLIDHDEYLWATVGNLPSFEMAPADIPLVELLLDSVI
jgi:8-oxo-dGTP diphosphatase